MQFVGNDKQNKQSEYTYNHHNNVTDPISQDNQVHDTLTCTYCSIHCRLCLRRRVITKNISNSSVLLIKDKQNKLTVQPPNFLPAPTLSPPAQTDKIQVHPLMFFSRITRWGRVFPLTVRLRFYPEVQVT